MTTLTSPKYVLAGVWHNQHNSEMRLEIDETGKIVGSFVNGISKQGGRSETFPLTGFVRDDVFSFCVDFSKYGCMTAWVGQIVDPANKRFVASWQMIADAHQKEDLVWKSVWIGQDTFESGPRKSEVSTEHVPASHPLFCGII